MFGRDGFSITPEQFVTIKNQFFSIRDIQQYSRYLHKMEKASQLQLLVQENGVINE